MTMRIVMGHVDHYDEDTAKFALQLGLKGVQLHNPDNLPADKGYWAKEDVCALKVRCEADGLTLEGLENVPVESFNLVQRGAPGRDEQIEKYQVTIKNLGAAGVPVLGYNFLPGYVWRTEMEALGRGGARVTTFDLSREAEGNALTGYKLAPDMGDIGSLTEAHLWESHQYFLDAVLPVAEAAGVRLALHPDDPPVKGPLGGYTRILTTPAALRRAHEQAGGSHAWGLNLCLGTVSEMGGAEAVHEVIDYFGPRGAICCVHFRDVHGTVPKFEECFLGEGNLRVPDVLRQLSDVGFDGFIIDDHVPAMVADKGTWGDISSEAYCSRGRAYAIGYLQGALEAGSGLHT